MIIDGRAFAEEAYVELANARVQITAKIKLGIIVASIDPVIESFIRIKGHAADRLDVDMIRRDLLPGSTTENATDLVRELSSECDGIIVQLPLPDYFDTEAVLASIPNEKDVDGISPNIEEKDRIVHAPVAAAIDEILKRWNISPAGKKVVVVGAGRLVGKPAAWLFSHVNAELKVVTQEDGSLDDLKDADIVVLGAGNPGFVKPEHLKKDVVLIDAGTSESGGKVVGDADPACADVASLFTPVPGGVGPIAVAMIFKNLFELIDAKNNSPVV